MSQTDNYKLPTDTISPPFEACIVNCKTPVSVESYELKLSWRKLVSNHIIIQGYIWQLRH